MSKKSNRLSLLMISLLVYLTTGGHLPFVAPVQAETNGFATRSQELVRFVFEQNRMIARDISLGSVGDSSPNISIARSPEETARLQSRFPEPIKSKYL
jgi:hypothetical protein